MTKIETICKEIFGILSKKPEHVIDIQTREFGNLEKFNIRFKLAPDVREKMLHQTVWPSEEKRQEYIERTADGCDTLSSIHFDSTGTEFLPNELLWWKELAKGEYERVVNALYGKLTEKGNA